MTKTFGCLGIAFLFFTMIKPYAADAADPVKPIVAQDRAQELRSGGPGLARNKLRAFDLWRRSHDPHMLVAMIAEGDFVVVAAIDQFRIHDQPNVHFQYTYFDLYRTNRDRAVYLGGTPRFSPDQVATALRTAVPFGLPEPAAPSPEAVPVDAQAHTLLTAATLRLAANKRVAFDYFRIPIGSGRLDEIAQYATPRYIQHNPLLPSGRDALAKAFANIVKRQPVLASGIPGLVRVMAEGDRVVLVQKQIVNGVGEWHFDMFRVANGKLDEHWDAPPNAANVGAIQVDEPSVMFSAASLASQAH